MPKLILSLPVVVLAGLGLGHAMSAASAAAEEVPGAQVESEVVPGELLVRFADDVSESRIAEINARLGVEVVSRLMDGKILQVRVPNPAATADVMAVYAVTPGVVYAEPNQVHRTQTDDLHIEAPGTKF